MEYDEMRVAKTSNAGEIDRNCFPNRSSAFPAPLSVSSERGVGTGVRNKNEAQLTLKEQRKKGDHEHQEYVDDATRDPVENRCKEVAAICPVQQLAIVVEFADNERRV